MQPDPKIMIISPSILNHSLELIMESKEILNKLMTGKSQLENMYSLKSILVLNKYQWELELLEMLKDGTFHHQWINKKELNSKLECNKLLMALELMENIIV